MAYDYERDLKSKSTSIDIDLGLRAYMNKVYSFMAVGLALTGVIAHLTSTLAFNFTTNRRVANLPPEGGRGGARERGSAIFVSWPTAGGEGQRGGRLTRGGKRDRLVCSGHPSR